MPKQNLKAFTMIPLDNEEFYLKNEKLNILHLYIMERVRGFENNNLPCYISNDQFAKETNCSPSTIKRAIKLLIESKLLWGSYHQENVKNKQRILHIYREQTQNDHLTGSNFPPEKVKMTPADVQNDPLVNTKKKNNRLLTNNSKRENEKNQKRTIRDLTSDEASDIMRGLEKGTPYVDLAKKHNLEFGSITKDFKNQWAKISSERSYLAEQQVWLEQLKQKPRIDYANIHVKEETPEEKLHEEMVEQAIHEFLHMEPDPRPVDTGEPEALKIIRRMEEEKKAMGEYLWS